MFDFGTLNKAEILILAHWLKDTVRDWIDIDIALAIRTEIFQILDLECWITSYKAQYQYSKRLNEILHMASSALRKLKSCQSLTGCKLDILVSVKKSFRFSLVNKFSRHFTSCYCHRPSSSKRHPRLTSLQSYVAVNNLLSAHFLFLPAPTQPSSSYQRCLYIPTSLLRSCTGLAP